MYQILKHILFKSLLLIVGLHTFIPHPHAEELNEDEHRSLHQNSHSIFGIIKLIFHESDDDNLDCLLLAHYTYRLKHRLTDVPSSAFIFFEEYAEIREDVSRFFLSQNYFISTFKFYNSNGLRAPPASFCL